MGSIIEVDGLTKRYRNATSNAVDGISFSVRTGELFALLGPNGAGKTTTISILTTTLAPTSGTARIGGHDVRSGAALVRREVGIIFQKPSLDQNLTAEENVRLHAILYGLYPWRPTFSLMPGPYRQQVRELAALVGIDKEIFKPLRTFSGGMRRKLEIMRGLLHRPKVLFLDEPTAGLDVPSRRTLWEYLREVREQAGTTIFLTTHYIQEAEEADTVCILDRGRIVSFGTPDQVKAHLVQHYVLVDCEDRQRLRGELARLAIPYRDGPRVRIDLDGRTVHEVLRSVMVPLTFVATHAPTLEDAYLEIVGAKREGAAS